MISSSFAQQQLERPVLTAFVLSAVEAPLLALFLELLDDELTLSGFLMGLVVAALAMLWPNIVSMRAERNRFPAGLTGEDMLEVQQIVLHGRTKFRPELARAVDHYGRRRLKPHSEITTLCLAILLLAVAVFVYLVVDQSVLVAIAVGFFGLLALASCPLVRLQRRRIERSMASAREMLGLPAPPAAS